MLKQTDQNFFDMREDNIEQAARALKAMAHPLRLKILCVLGDQELPVMEIVDKVGTTQSNVSQHLDILREKGIVVSRREGSKILCRVKNQEILELMSAMQRTFCPAQPN
jgi:ArsR family transcriptional regulator